MSATVHELPSNESSGSFPSSRLDAQIMRNRNFEHKSLRNPRATDLITECEHEHPTWCGRVARLVRRMCDVEKPIVYSDERIVFTHGAKCPTHLFTRRLASGDFGENLARTWSEEQYLCGFGKAVAPWAPGP